MPSAPVRRNQIINQRSLLKWTLNLIYKFQSNRKPKMRGVETDDWRAYPKPGAAGPDKSLSIDIPVVRHTPFHSG